MGGRIHENELRRIFETSKKWFASFVDVLEALKGDSCRTFGPLQSL